MGNSCWTCPPSPVLATPSQSRLSKPIVSYSEQAAQPSSLQSHLHSLSQVRSKKKAIDRDWSQAPSREATNAQISDRLKTAEDRKLILGAFQRHIIFGALDEESKEAVLLAMKLLRFPPREFVIEETFRATYFFVMIAGKAEKLTGGERTGLIVPGECFGEIALMHNQPRSMSVRTLEESEFWALDRLSFRHFVELINARAQEETELFVRSNSLFRGLTEFQREALVSSLTVCSYVKGAEIISEGAHGDWIYFLKEGEITCRKKDKLLRRMRAGEFFGELAFLSGGRRTATVTAATDVKCMYLSAHHFVTALGDCVQNVIYTNTIKIALELSGVSGRLLPSQLDRLVRALRIECFDNGSVVVYKDTPLSSGLWIVLRGKLQAAEKVFAGTFDSFGLQTSEVASDDILVSSDIADIAWLTLEEVEKVIECSWSNAPANLEAFALLKRVTFFGCLSEQQLLRLALSAKLQHFSDKQSIASSDCFYVLKSGEVACPENCCEDVTCFGESALFEDVAVPALTRGAVSCWVLTRSDFEHAVSAPLRELLRLRLSLYDSSMSLQDLVPVKLLGRGMFGLVLLVYSQAHKCFYALKSISRPKISHYGLHRNVVLERDIMLQLDHPLVLKLVKTFKDPKRVYFLTEYVRGTDFFEVLRVLGLVQDSEAKFYVASLLLVLEYLHGKSIAYRDLKPENVMVDEEGYIKLIDFGTAKVVSGRTYSVVGTPHYMAPEIILGKGYGLFVDLWSLGVVLYEMECGAVPFGEDEEDPYAVYEHTLDHQLCFPELLDSRTEVKLVIQQLLSANPASRSSGGALHLKKHKWLKGFDWEALVSRTLPPPFKPKAPDSVFLEIRRSKDVQTTVESEETEEWPLSACLSVPPVCCERRDGTVSKCGGSGCTTAQLIPRRERASARLGQ